jgi:trimeric autotransporter adhesin
MKNVYDGVATLDAKGEAVIQMPEWFGVLNRDFRYQLTCIGGFAPVYIAEELGNNQFKIGGGRTGMRVSWQITGIRQDPWANAHRIPVEQEKEAKLKGFYIHPELYGAPAEKQIEWARHPQMMKKLQEARQLTTQQPRPPAEFPAKQTPLRLPHSAALLPAKK